MLEENFPEVQGQQVRQFSDAFNSHEPNDAGGEIGFSYATADMAPTNSSEKNSEDTDNDDANPLAFILPKIDTVFFRIGEEVMLSWKKQKVLDEETKEYRKEKQESNIKEQTEEVQQKRKRPVKERQRVTEEERKIAWYIDPRIKIEGKRRDKIFLHLKTGVQCRSTKEVYKYIKYDITPKESREIRVDKPQQEESLETPKAKEISYLREIFIGGFNIKTKQFINQGKLSSTLEGYNNGTNVDINISEASVNSVSGKKAARDKDNAQNEDDKAVYIGRYVNFVYS